MNRSLGIFALALGLLTAGAAVAAAPPAEVKTQRIAFLGTATTQATPQQQTAAGLPEGVGLFVQHVLAGSPADLAGLQRGDLLHKLDDQLLVNDPQFRVLLRMQRPGATIRLATLRDGQPRAVSVRLGEKEVPVGDVPAAELLPWLLRPTLPPDAVAAAGFSANYEDGEHVLALSLGENGKHLLVKDKKGAVLFDGPVETPEQRKAVPAAVQAKLRQLETPPKPKGPAKQ